MKKYFLGITLFALGENCFSQQKNVTKRKHVSNVFNLRLSDYEDRVHAIWASQIISFIIGLRFENNEKAVKWVDQFPKPISHAPVDDDYYYEMITLKAFEKYGSKMTVEQLGAQWLHDSCGVWGSSAAAKKAMLSGIAAPMSGHPFNNRLYFTIGPMFTADVYGALTPGMPNVAAKLAKYYTRVNGYAEANDGAVFIAALVSAAFNEKDMKEVVKKAASIIHTKSPVRQVIEMVMAMDKEGNKADEIFEAIETKWRPVYPMPNNAVANAGITAVCLLKGEGNYLQTLNLACTAGDNTDADCNAASASAVVSAMHGTKAIPKYLIDGLHNRIKGDKMAKAPLPPVDESITNLAARTVHVGKQILLDNGAQVQTDFLNIPVQEIVSQPSDFFTVNDMLQKWDADWKIEHSRIGTYVEDGALITFPAIPTRSMYLQRTLTVADKTKLMLTVAAEQKKSWKLRVFLDNDKVLERLIESADETDKWKKISINLSKYKGKDVIVRLYQNVDLADKIVGNAYWQKVILE